MPLSRGIASLIEFPKASGIRIGAVSNKTNGKKFSLSYRVNLPAAMTGKGRVLEIPEREAYRVKLFMDLIDQSQKGLYSALPRGHALAVRDLINQMKKAPTPTTTFRGVYSVSTAKEKSWQEAHRIEERVHFTKKVTSPE